MLESAEVTKIYRGLRRRINGGVPLDSYPFLSGDSYFFSCQYFFTSGSVKKVPIKSGRHQKENSLFVNVGELEKFSNFLEKCPSRQFENHSLIIHNGDDAIQDESLNFLAQYFLRIYAVNLLKISDKFSPIPIGLENHRLFTNGVPSDFSKLISSGLPSFGERKISILKSYSHHTNPSERLSCSQIASRIGSTSLHEASPFQYRKALTNSRFVLSPMGNGLDCHRTWEAMYLGAVPIVRRIHWPFINRRLPILLIDEWKELLDLDFSSFQFPEKVKWSQEFWDDFYEI